MTSSVRYTGRNTVKIDYEIVLPDGAKIKGANQCTSGENAGAPTYYRRRADGKDGKGRPQYFHMWDPDAQLFDWLANEVFDHYDNDPDAYYDNVELATGTVAVVDDQGPCHSCRSVITQFKREFKKVKITVRYTTGDKLRPAVPAGTGSGLYGYDKGAEHQGEGVWLKTL